MISNIILVLLLIGNCGADETVDMLNKNLKEQDVLNVTIIKIPDYLEASSKDTIVEAGNFFIKEINAINQKYSIGTGYSAIAVCNIPKHYVRKKDSYCKYEFTALADKPYIWWINKIYYKNLPNDLKKEFKLWEDMFSKYYNILNNEIFNN